MRPRRRKRLQTRRWKPRRKRRRNRGRDRGAAGLRRPRAVGGLAARGHARAGAREEPAAWLKRPVVEAARAGAGRNAGRGSAGADRMLCPPRLKRQRLTRKQHREAVASDAAPAEAAPQKPRPMRRSCLKWWKSGGPAAVRKNAVRTMTATASVHQGRPQERSSDGAQPAAAAGEGGEAAAPGREQRHRRGRRHNEFRKPREGAPVEANASAAGRGRARQEARAETAVRRASALKARARRESRDNKGGGRPEQVRRRSQQGRSQQGRWRRDKGGRDFGGRDKGGRDKRDSGPSHRQ